MNLLRQYIEKRKRELGLSQNQVAKKAGRSASWLSHYMTEDRKDIKVESLIILAKGLNDTPERLLLAYRGYDPDEYSKFSREDFEKAIYGFMNSMPKDVIQEICEKFTERGREKICQ